MSQTKVQLIQPVGIMTAPGVNVSGTLTATTFDGNLVGAAGSIIGTPNVNAGIVTAVSFYGNGENLTGVAGSTFIGVVTAAQSGTTTIDLSLGNIIYFTQDTNTTVAFANTESTQVLDFIRAKDDTTTARTITWPDSIIWNGGSAPTLIDSSNANDVQIFKLITRDQGVTWYGYEPMKNDPAEPARGMVVMGGSAYLLGINDALTTSYSSPVQLPGTGWNGMWGGYNETAGTKTDGTLWTWGGNSHGGLGHNDRVQYSSPRQIPGTQWKSNGPDASAGVVGSGQDNMFAIKTDGTLWVWGHNDYGKLGLSDTTPRSSPTQLPGTQWKEGLDNAFHFLQFIKTDGTLWASGGNGMGQLGQNNRTEYQSPRQVPGTQWSSISAGYYGAIASKTDGTLWAWGYNAYGECGQNDRANRSSPTQVPGTSWEYTRGKFAAFGSAGGLGIKTDGTLWAWGDGDSGALAQNDRVQHSSPIQIPGTQWNYVDGGPIFSDLIAATKTDGTLWVWGNGTAGRLGNLSDNPRSSPMQIPGTQWSSLNVGNTIWALES